ncbi:thioredoxin-like protein [Basidiobolus meristosporus CBS 931.73]|uniref:Thioredoxin-like protein n=1 Tax=Basidiobolus meristosporus CBS 931.73 TaxID=1314790 RepID=A0A1Y1XMY4_9FUNG|nr:thioredoxin-like protein [Basidiobolus meristosporus CBS 931.73]|eukprot:ORX87092.1 thioredoxin-like protein [Basidiobolus meristosporus CBS 931.73]
MEARLRQVGEGEGINFVQDGTLGNTLDSHRLIYFAQARGKQNDAVEAIFKAYFEQGKNLADPTILVGIAGEIGLDKEEFQRYLLSGDGDDEVRSEIQEHRKYINGVPYFTINQEYRLSGAQDSSEFLSAFKKAIGKASGEASRTGQTCSDGACAL